MNTPSLFAIPTRFGPLFDPAADGGATPAPNTPAGGVTPPPKSGGLNLDEPITFGGQTLKVGEVIAQAQRAKELEARAKELETVAEAAKRMTDPTTPEEDRVKAARVVLKARGLNEQQIEEYLQDVNGEPEDAQPEKSKETPPAGDPGDVAFKADFIRYKLGTLTGAALDGSGPLGTLLGKLKASDENGSYKEAKNIIAKELESELVARAHARKNAARGQFRVSFLDEEVGAAEKAVADKYGRIFGNLLSKLGRTPSVLTDEESSFRDSKPMAPPKYKPGMQRGEIDAALDAYNADALSRLAIDVKLEESTGSKA